MKNMKFKVVLPICILLLAALLGGCGRTSPETQQTNATEKSITEKALSAYQEILKAAPAIEGEHAQLDDATFDYEQNQKLFGEHFELFAICDINKDDIPELIALSTVNFRWTPVSVYTYMDGEAVLLKDPADMAAHGSFEQYSGANGAYTTYICAENHIHSVWRGTNPMGGAEEENHAYALDGAGLTAVDCAAGESENTVSFFDIALANTAENADAITK